MKRRRLLAPVLAVLCPLALVGGIYLGGHPDLLPGAARDTLVADSEGRLYDEALDAIADDYYRPVDRRDLLNQSLDGAVESLSDRFSNYFSPRDYRQFERSTSGQFVGIGVSVRDEKKIAKGLKVLTVYDNSPAQRAGIKKGDLITEVDGRTTRGQSTDEVTAAIRGPVGTAVRLTFGAGERRRTERVERDEVALPVVRSKLVRAGGRSYAHVRLASFTSGAHAEVGGAVRRLLKRGADGVVLDLRDNGGGLLDEAVLISSIFIPEGPIVSTDGRHRDRKVYKATGSAIDTEVPVVVLVNRNSASASEIVTGALQDRKRAKVVGTATYGKGVFQEVKRLSNGGALDITVGEYFLPSGRNLGGGGVKRGAGITPDVQAKDDPKTPRDEGLDRALDVLGG
ncbi:MAG TPA: S41 family peptidase [Solirubrobacteraceae bacterium]|jgi:carboxyl-terminal processing protease